MQESSYKRSSERSRPTGASARGDERARGEVRELSETKEGAERDEREKDDEKTQRVSKGVEGSAGCPLPDKSFPLSLALSRV